MALAPASSFCGAGSESEEEPRLDQPLGFWGSQSQGVLPSEGILGAAVADARAAAAAKTTEFQAFADACREAIRSTARLSRSTTRPRAGTVQGVWAEAADTWHPRTVLGMLEDADSDATEGADAGFAGDSATRSGVRATRTRIVYGEEEEVEARLTGAWSGRCHTDSPLPLPIPIVIATECRASAIRCIRLTEDRLGRLGYHYFHPYADHNVMCITALALVADNDGRAPAHAMPEAVVGACSAALHLASRGLEPSCCFVPFISCSGTLEQHGIAYLLEPCAPCAVLTSPVLDLLSGDGVLRAVEARWVMKCIADATERRMAALLQTQTRAAADAQRRAAAAEAAAAAASTAAAAPRAVVAAAREAEAASAAADAACSDLRGATTTASASVEGAAALTAGKELGATAASSLPPRQPLPLRLPLPLPGSDIVMMTPMISRQRYVFKRPLTGAFSEKETEGDACHHQHQIFRALSASPAAAAFCELPQATFMRDPLWGAGDNLTDRSEAARITFAFRDLTKQGFMSGSTAATQPAAVRREFFAQLQRALLAIHAAGVVHCDVYPHKIMWKLTPTGTGAITGTSSCSSGPRASDASSSSLPVAGGHHRTIAGAGAGSGTSEVTAAVGGAGAASATTIASAPSAGPEPPVGPPSNPLAVGLEEPLTGDRDRGKATTGSLKFTLELRLVDWDAAMLVGERITAAADKMVTRSGQRVCYHPTAFAAGQRARAQLDWWHYHLLQQGAPFGGVHFHADELESWLDGDASDADASDCSHDGERDDDGAAIPGAVGGGAASTARDAGSAARRISVSRRTRLLQLAQQSAAAEVTAAAMKAVA